MQNGPSRGSRRYRPGRPVENVILLPPFTTARRDERDGVRQSAHCQAHFSFSPHGQLAWVVRVRPLWGLPGIKAKAI